MSPGRSADLLLDVADRDRTCVLGESLEWEQGPQSGGYGTIQWDPPSEDTSRGVVLSLLHPGCEATATVSPVHRL